MTVKEFKAAFDKQPFEPFTVRLPDGRALPILHRDFAFLSPQGRTLIVYQPDGACNIVDLMLVSDLQYDPPSPASP